MARTKQTSRNKSNKRPPLAVRSPKSPKRKLREIKQASSSDSSSYKWSYFSSPGPNETTFTKGHSNKMQGLPENAGKWLLFPSTDHCYLGGASHLHHAWKVAKDLVMDFKNTGIISAKCSPVEDSESDSDLDAESDQGVVCFYTSNYKDKLSVKHAADAIFQAYPYPLSMYFKPEKNASGEECNKCKKEFFSIYKYTIENKFYERSASDNCNWMQVECLKEAVPACSETTISYREIMPCKVASHQWLFVSSFEQNCERFVVKSLNYVENLPYKAGKWLLFNNFSDVCPLAGVTHHDFAWKSLKHLVIDSKNSKVIAIKCSTNRIDAYHPAKGVTCCYTEEFDDKLSIKIAATAIRKAFHYPDNMYYKIEEDSDGDSSHGDKHTTIYRHTISGELYERAKDNPTWKVIP